MVLPNILTLLILKEKGSPIDREVFFFWFDTLDIDGDKEYFDWSQTHVKSCLFVLSCLVLSVCMGGWVCVRRFGVCV